MLSYSESIMLLLGFQWFAMSLVCVRVHMSVWSFCWAYSEGSEVWWPAIGRGLFKRYPWILPFKDTFEQLHCCEQIQRWEFLHIQYAHSPLINLFHTYKPKYGNLNQVIFIYIKRNGLIQTLQSYVWYNTWNFWNVLEEPVYEPTGYRLLKLYGASQFSGLFCPPQ